MDLETIKAKAEIAVPGCRLQVIDVRGAAEWSAGHIPGVRNIPLASLTDHLDELARDRPVVLHC